MARSKMKVAGKHDKAIRLGGGEFQHREGFNASRIEPGLPEAGPTAELMTKQALFMRAAFDVAPEAQDSLEEIYDELPNVSKEGLTPAIPKEKIDGWCTRHRLDVPWCKEFAIQLVETWRLQSQQDGERYSFDALRERNVEAERRGQPFQENHLAIDFGFWPITTITKSEFREQCKRLLETEFETFCDRIEKLALDARMERTHEKRETDHFYWLSEIC